jgi:hypothetical protein
MAWPNQGPPPVSHTAGISGNSQKILLSPQPRQRRSCTIPIISAPERKIVPSTHPLGLRPFRRNALNTRDAIRVIPLRRKSNLSNTFSNSTAAAQRARDLSNAAKTGAQAPVRNNQPVPNPAHKPMVLPKMTVIPRAKDPNSYNRPGSAPMIHANKGPAVRAPQTR